MKFPAHSFRRDLRIPTAGNYYLSVPAARARGGKQWPLLLFLHGMGGDRTVLESNGPHTLMPPRRMQESIVCLPTCSDTRWPTDMILGLVQHLTVTLPVDPRRIYLTGVSIGGLATWELALRRPALFAAIVPLCGAGQPWNAERIAHVPCWAFHGAKDKIVPVAETTAMVRALRESGGAPKLTILKPSGHEIAAQVYQNRELWKWIFAQSNRRPDPAFAARTRRSLQSVI